MANLATDKNRWIALVFLAMSLAIVIIDNTVLNVAVPYILRDLKTTFDSIQWVISGYALIIATLLVTVGRLGDLFGRKRVLQIGVILFAIGSFIASISQSVRILFVGEALIEAIGATMMMTSSLSLLVSEFRGRERAIAFGVWGSVAGASAAIGPLLGGYLTAYYSWRWSLRINVVVAIIALLGSTFIIESKGEGEKRFDWLGTVLSGTGLFSLVFGLIEGQTYGWWLPNKSFAIGSWTWPLTNISIIPLAFIAAACLLAIFVIAEHNIEKRGGSPLMRPSLFKNHAFSLGLATLTITALGQFGVFFILPIFLQNVLGFNAFKTGLVILPTSLSAFIFGPLSGFIASKIGPKWLIVTGMAFFAAGTYALRQSLSIDTTEASLAPALILFGTGIGTTSAQLTNLILSGVPVQLAGEGSAINSTMRQVGTSVGIAIIGVALANALTSNIANYVQNDAQIPTTARSAVITDLKNISIESGQQAVPSVHNPALAKAIHDDVENAMVQSSKTSLDYAVGFTLVGTILALFLPGVKPHALGNTPHKPSETAAS